MDKKQEKQKTFAIIKPDAVERGLVGEIISRIEDINLQIIACKMKHLTLQEASKFYDIHKDRPFFKELVAYMSSGPVLLMILSGDNAVESYRSIMGDTDPNKAEKGTIRGDLAVSIDANCVHGSDSLENAKIEILSMFEDYEICEQL